jgi:pimeloyl-ACP methyl ester carboxylesterase
MQSYPAVQGVTHSFVTINGANLHVAEAGKGKSLLLLHGWPQHWYVWRKIIPELSKQYHLIMPDLPGFGWSEMPKGKDFRKEKLAEDILQLIHILKLKKVSLIGHDWGGWIGFLMCQKEPSYFNDYLALGIGFPFSANPIAPLQLWRFLYQLPIATPFLGETLLELCPQLTAWGMEQCAYKKDIWTKEELQTFTSILQNPKKAQASSLLYRTFLTKELKQVKDYQKQAYIFPTKLLIGNNDPIINPSLFQNRKAEKAVKREIIKNCGHFIPEERPEIVVEWAKRLFE